MYLNKIENSALSALFFQFSLDIPLPWSFMNMSDKQVQALYITSVSREEKGVGFTPALMQGFVTLVKAH